ncbi:CZB domain-containing protein [Hymenobacter psychrotolerans]|uniref:Chemoreceptor zinc-binding domain-containing protein n=1 Tax=Hymenobacter psychrotolerans DSM 18569 TaxID=1121959 RepID=A0A1M6TX26_9BACT|nr:CZB domain-containing protein [Hymenobacter psychrotolerans]SHK61585.1 Chemoreceptor zinc-binding domain-containing protein [Hymenobacter psychrotolerans DSM 18569]
MTDELKQDFESGLVKHLLFKSKLRSYLYGSGISQGPIRDPHQCNFGHWIRDRALGPYKHLPESHELDRLHVQVHQEANRLMDLHKQGQTDVALAGMPVIDQLAERITVLLQTMEHRLRTGL